MNVCIGCGCDEEYGCDIGCEWVRLDRIAGVGVCSSCPEEVSRFDAGDRTLSNFAEQEVSLLTDFEDEAERDTTLILPGDQEFDEVLRSRLK